MEANTFLTELNEARSSDISGFISRMKKHPGIEKIVDVWSDVDGMSALVRLKDGNALEVSIRPARYAKNPMIRAKTK